MSRLKQISWSWLRASIRPVIVALVILALMTAACGNDTDTASNGSDEELIPIKVGGQASITGAVDMIGLEKGFFDEEGLDVDFVRLSSGREVRDALIAGSVDVGGVAPAPFVAAASSGELLAIATLGLIGDTVAVVAGAETGIETVEDLRGKTIAAQEGSSSELIFLEKVLPSGGLDVSDVNMLNAQESDHPAVLSGGQVDAVIANEPFISIAAEQGIGHVVTPYTPFDPFPNLILGRTAYIEENPEAVQRFVTAHVRTMVWMSDNMEESADLVQQDLAAQGVELDQEIILSALERVNLDPQFPTDFEGYLSETFDLLSRADQVEGDEPNWEEVVEPRFLDEAL